MTVTYSEDDIIGHKPDMVGSLIFWEFKKPDGTICRPFQFDLNFKPSRWQLFKFWLIGIKWVNKKDAL